VEKLLEYLFQKTYPEIYILRALLARTFKINSAGENPSRSNFQITFNNNKLLKIVTENKLNHIILELCNRDKVVENLFRDLLPELNKNEIADILLFKRHQTLSVKIMSILTKNACDFVVMKTYLLKKDLYNNQTIKITADLDLLVPLKEFNKISSILIREGYKHLPVKKGTKGAGPAIFSPFYQPKTQESFQKNNHIIEVHTVVVDTFKFLAYKEFNRRINEKLSDQLYRGTRYIRLGANRVKVFRSEDLLISLFLHSFFQHNMQIVISYYEVASVLSKNKLDWNYLEKIVRNYSLDAFFWWYMSILDELFPNVCNIIVKKKIRDFRHSFSLSQKFFFKYMGYKIFMPSRFRKSPNKEQEKELYWSIIRNNLFSVLIQRISRKLSY